MTTSLALLIQKLSHEVAARNGVPDSVQYSNAVKDAVLDYSRRNPLRKRVAVSIVSGTATYTLPADFMEVISFPSILEISGGNLVTDSGIIPVSDSFKEEYEIVDGRLTIYPTPAYTATRYLWYQALYALDDNQIYQDLDAFGASLVFKKASAICLRVQANRAAQEGWSYQIGDERVDKTKLSDILSSRASELESEYLAEVAKATKTGGLFIGRRSDYSAHLR